MGRQRHASALLVFLLLLLSLAACGGGGDGATPTAAITATTATTASGATTPVSTATASVGTTTPGTAAASPAATSAATPLASPGTGAAGGAASPATTGAGAQRYAIVPETSKATYKVNETFFNQNNRLNTAEGSTAISGDIFIDKGKPSASRIGTITVDISKLESDSGRRDDMIRNNWLESAKFPTATFVPKRLEGLPDTPYTDGQELTFKIVGDLTVRTVTKEVTFDAKGKIVGDTFTGTATTQFTMTDFGFDPPSIIGVLKTENGVILELTIEAKRAP